MFSQGLISVIVPVYKVEAYLDQCIESIIKQTYTKLEIILVDDGSPDQCPAMCEAWKESDARIQVIHKENGGLSSARNKGMAVSTGEFISFIDSDDWIAPEMMQRLIDSMKYSNSDIAACSVSTVGEDGSPDLLFTVRSNCVMDRSEAQEALLEETLIKQPVWYKLYRHEIIKDLLFPDGRFQEDVYWSYQAIGNADKISIIDYIGYYYRQRSDSIMGNGYSLKRLDVLDAIERRYLYIAKYFPELEKEARLKILSSCIYHTQMALKYLPAEEKRIAIRRLDDVKKRYYFRRNDYSDQKLTHRLWYSIGRYSLLAAGMIKNLFGIGL